MEEQITPQEKKPCYLCRLLKNVVIFSVGVVVGLIAGFFLAVPS